MFNIVIMFSDLVQHPDNRALDIEKAKNKI